MHSRLVLMVTGISLALSSAAAAQGWDGAEQRRGFRYRDDQPDAERARAERRERIRNLIQSRGDLLNSKAAEENVSPLNDALRDLLERFMSRDPAVESFDLQLDREATNLAEDRLGLVGELALKRTAWSQEPGEFSGKIRARVETSALGKPQAIVKAECRLQTDIFALLNYTLPRIREDLVSTDNPPTKLPPPPGQPAASWNAEAALNERLAHAIDEIGTIDSLAEVRQLLDRTGQVRRSVLQEKIARLQSVVATAAAAEQPQLEAQLKEAIAERDNLPSVVLTAAQGPDNTEQLVVTMRSPETAPLALDCRCVIEEKQAQWTFTATLNEGVEYYQLAKPVIQQLLERLRQRRSEGDGRILERFWQRQRAAIVGEIPA